MSKTTNKFSPEVRARAVRMVLDHEGDYPLFAPEPSGALVGCGIGCWKDRLRPADASRMGEEGRGRQRYAFWRPG